jgi:sigma-B regulation protein RsbU (phosphoserine phosphatase)
LRRSTLTDSSCDLPQSLVDALPVTEALDANGDEFGVDRMVECVRANAPKGAPALITGLIDELRSFVGAQPQNDDITLIAIRKT